jgi:8-oxo-dGTP pyrophosphatase MutT (NUDIX family)
MQPDVGGRHVRYVEGWIVAGMPADVITSGSYPGKPAKPVMPTDPTDPRLRELAARVARHVPAAAAAPPGAGRAAVALVVRPGPGDLELLLIRRAERERDPWSGHMALPGGRVEPRDPSLRATAERETHEEVGIELSRHGRWVAELDSVFPRAGAPAVVVTPFVFTVGAATPASPNAEVHAAFWIPLSTLAAATSLVEHRHPLPNGAWMRFPGLHFEGHVIWGLTYRVLAQFFDVAGHAALPDSPG